MRKLKAFSKKYKSRALLIGNTSFSFDSDGYCEIDDLGNAKSDFEALLKKNHVEEVLYEPEELDLGEARGEDIRGGLDEELLKEEPETLDEERVDEEPETLDEPQEEEHEETLEELYL